MLRVWSVVVAKGKTASYRSVPVKEEDVAVFTAVDEKLLAVNRPEAAGKREYA